MRSPYAIRRRKQRGLSLITAVFILLVFGLLAAALVRLLQLSDTSVAREVLATRALHAAESGTQRQLGEIFLGGGACPLASPFNAPMDCTVNLSCSAVEVPAGSGDFYYDIVSTGRCGPAGEQAVRVLEVRAQN